MSVLEFIIEMQRHFDGTCQFFYLDEEITDNNLYIYEDEKVENWTCGVNSNNEYGDIFIIEIE